jgi:5-methylphenazine-1-carboxylate 1-monooxygenase
MVIAGGNAAKFVFYPIYFVCSQPETRLTNWTMMARLGDGPERPPRHEDWNRPGRLRVRANRRGGPEGVIDLV